jgi:adenylate cyclase
VSSQSNLEQRARAIKLWRRRAVASLACGIVLGGLAAMPAADWLGRVSLDFHLPLRHWMYGALNEPAASPAVVVAIDEETYRTEPFASTPKVAWTPHLADVIDAVGNAGAKVIGLDLVYPATLDRQGLLQGYDRPLLKTLFQHGRKNGNLVMGEVRLSRQSISPYIGQVRAVGGADNVRLLNVLPDWDNVVRRYIVSHALEGGGEQLSFAMELAQRAGATVPKRNFLINFNTGASAIPSYSFADLWLCAADGNAAFFERQFKDKVVIFGTNLDLEDRHLSSRRFANAPYDTGATPRCKVEAREGMFDTITDRKTMPGVFIHAAAVNTVLMQRPVTRSDRGTTFAIVGGTTAALALLFFLLPPVWGVAAMLGVDAAGTAAGTWLLKSNFLIPSVTLAIAAFLAFAGIYGYRFLVEGKEKRHIRNAFRHFLAPALVDRLADDPDSLKLGGERKRVTIFFSDIAGFTNISESLRDTPETLVDILNRYLTIMTDRIEKNGGYVDKYQGDAVMALWGVPLDDHEAERNAANAILDCFDGLEQFNKEIAEEMGLASIGTRIGVNTGHVVAGNMGSESRFNYTVMGDAVNLAARLESANKAYGTRNMIGAATARALNGDFVLRRLDRLVVKGKSIPEKVFEIVGRKDEIAESEIERVRAFHAALALYYRRRFAAARDAFAALAEIDPVAKVYVERCAVYLENPPPVPWNRAFELETK